MAIQYTAVNFLSRLSENNYSYTNTYKKKVRESNADVETLQDDIAELKKTVKDLGRYTKGVTSQNRLEKKLKKFVKTYNSMDKNAEKVSNDELEKQFEKLEKLFSENEKDLKKIGLKRSDKKLEFDSDVFKDADNKIINKLFEGRNCFIKQADKLMRKIEECADNSQYSMVERNLTKTTRYDENEMSLACFFIDAKENMELLGLYSGLIEAGGFSEEYKENCEKELKYFTDLACNNAVNYEDENYNNMKALCEDKKEELAKIGITFEDGISGENTMKYDETLADLNQPDVQSAYVSLFGKDSEFIKNLMECCNKGFNAIIKPEKLGVSIVDVCV